MELTYQTIKEFEDHYNASDALWKLAATKCSCGQYCEMQLQDVTVHIAEYTIHLCQCPVMVCEDCGHQHLCPDIPQEIYKTYFRMEEKGASECRLTMNSDIRYEFAKSANFKYDSRDMCIPGLGVDLDPTNPAGFSCPVYFDRKVLNNFLTDDDYELDFFSESYGAIAKKGTGGWIYEWKIVFGVNKNNKVILFLGDLAQIDDDDRAIYWLKSYNIDSDHVIVGTELYQGQLNCIFSEPIKEKRIIALRNSFYKKIKEKYGVELFHLEAEVEAKGNDIQKPINYSEGEIKANIITLDGVLNEGIDCDELRKLCSQVVNPNPPKLKDLKTRKLLQHILTVSAGETKAEELIAPLFYLNGLRVYFAHLLPQETLDEYKDTIINAYGLTSFSEYRKLYDALIDDLYFLYRYLNVTEI